MPGEKKPRECTSSANLRRSSASGIQMFEVCMPARLKVLLGAVQLTTLSANSGHASSISRYSLPGQLKSQWISSATMTVPYFPQISPIRRSSSADQMRPTGLCGLQRMNSLTPFSAIFRSMSSKSISYLPSLRISGFSTILRPLFLMALLNG